MEALDQLQAIREGRSLLSVIGEARETGEPVVARYARISDDQEDTLSGDRGAGVRRQLQQIDALIDSRGWRAADTEYTDNDFSAFKESVVRPGFERMLEDLSAGLIDGVVCYDLDRFVRRPDDLERAIKIYDQARERGHRLYFASAQGDINLASDDGIATARILVAFANKASRDTARRVRLKHAANRDSKRLVGGTRPFGWRWHHEDRIDQVTGLVHRGVRLHLLVTEEADLIRATAGEIIADGGANWARWARRWNEAGFTSPRGRPWTQQTVRGVMRNPRLAGWITHKGRIAVHSTTGEPLRASFDPIIADDELEALLIATTSGPSGATKGQDDVRRYLLSGLVRCGNCGATMDGGRRNDRSEQPLHYYACKPGSRLTPDGLPACGRVSCSGTGLDALVEELVLPRLIAASKNAHLRPEMPFAGELAVLGERREELLGQHRDEILSAEAVFPEVARLERQIKGLRKEQAKQIKAQGVSKLAAGITEMRWASDIYTTAEKRQLVADQISALVIARTTRRTGRRFDYERVTPVWRAPDD